MTPEPAQYAQPNRDVELLKFQITFRLEIYKAHYDQFVKGSAIYLAVVGTLVGLMFRPDINRHLRCGLCLLLSLYSAISFAACMISTKWIREYEPILNTLCDELRIARFSLRHAYLIVSLTQALTVLVFSSGIVAFVYFWRA